VKSKHLNRRQLFLLVAVTIVTTSLTLLPLRELVFTRISNAPVATEQLSSFGREWLTQKALTMIQLHPLTGVGIGSFVIELSKYAVEGAIIEPVHNLILLIGAELGIIGIILLIGICITIASQSLKAKTPRAILASAALMGLGVISLFDHYLWSLAPGRIMLALALGLWLGAIKHDS
jgi:O-antigen ligase